MKFLFKNFIFGLSLFALLASCSDDGNQPLPSPNPPPVVPPPLGNTTPVNILTVIIGNNRFVSGSENWIFINTEDGDLMDVKQVENGQTVNFSSTLDVSKFNVTWFEQKLIVFASAPSDQSLQFQTYLSISKGSKIVLLNTPSEQQGSFSIGTVHLSVSNYFESDFPASTLALSNGFDLPLPLSKFTTPIFVNNIFSTSIPVIFEAGSNVSSLFIAGYKSSTPVFSFPKGIPSNGSINLNYNDFKEFDHVIDVNGSIDAGIVGQLNMGGNPRRYVLSGTNLLFLTQQSNGPKKIAYNDGFDSYTTFVIGNKFNYLKNGSAPSTFKMPQSTPTIEVQSGSMQSFNFTVSDSYTFFRAGWFQIKDNNIMQWSVIGNPESRFRMNAIPPDLATKFPVLTINLNFGSVKVTKHLSDFTYADQLDRLFLLKKPEVEEYFEFAN